jgi:hypothetical protein
MSSARLDSLFCYQQITYKINWKIFLCAGSISKKKPGKPSSIQKKGIQLNRIAGYEAASKVKKEGAQRTQSFSQRTQRIEIKENLLVNFVFS